MHLPSSPELIVRGELRVCVICRMQYWVLPFEMASEQSTGSFAAHTECLRAIAKLMIKGGVSPECLRSLSRALVNN